ncbi:hypothetical protein LXL04_037476 [Taraxacum kok-saghyz]
MECHRNGCKSRMFLGLGKECGNNSLCHGSVHEFIQDKEVRLIGVEHAAYLVIKINILMCYGAGPEVSFLKDLRRIECYTTDKKKQTKVHIFSY